ncbi:MAG TPA: ATP-binding protein [Thermoleophilaceae bacterium]|nr:ATP-binding protein [Thermoleophilaceae bacterium]
MAEARRPRGLRARLTLWIGAILILAVAASFFGIYRGTGQQLRNQLDRDLETQAGAFAAALPGGDEGHHELSEIINRYVNNQPFRASSQLLFARLPDGRIITNEPELLGLPGALDPESESTAAQAAENTDARTLRAAPLGFTTVKAADLGGLRVFVKQVVRHGRVVARVGVGEPLAPVTRAQHGVAKTFLLAGLFALIAAVLAGYVLASRVSSPLRRMAGTAAAVDAGDLSHRIGETGSSEEIRVLAEAFDHMLDRLDDAFARQRAFVSDASHELRTPLTILRGQLEVLARQKDVSREDVQRVTRLVSAETERMERLVDDLLLLAKTEEGSPLNRHPIELRDYMHDVLDAVSLTADRDFELGAVSDVSIEADPDRLAQVIHNLAQNAVAHTAEGGLVRLSAAANGRYVRFAVEDDGPGIPPDQRDRIFDRFHRTDISRARATGGSGLGLAIARALVEAHGGRIRAGESPEGGARLEFDLPR